MLTSLTPEQEAALAETREKWLRIGLSTEPADRARAEEGVRMAYRAAGLEPPQHYVWLRSPFEGEIGARFLAELLRSLPQFGGSQSEGADQVMDPVVGQIWDDEFEDHIGPQAWNYVRAQIRDNVEVVAQIRTTVMDQVENLAQGWARVGDQVRTQVDTQVGGQVWDQVGVQGWNHVRAHVSNRVWGQVGTHVMDQVMDQVGGLAEDRISYAAYGQHDANWLAFYDFFGLHCGIEVCSRFHGMNQIAASAGWWWPMRGAVVMTERPNVLKLDEEGRLHCEDGPALQYPDGWGVWSWHGVRVPQDVIEQPETLTCERIRDEANVEIRRIMLERFGTERYLRESGAVQVHQDEWGTLWQSEFADDEPLVMVEVVNATPEADGSFKDYFLRVPPTITTAREAVAWTFNVPAQKYAPIVES